MSNRPLILIAEDDASSADTLQMILDFAGFDVQIAETAYAAVAALTAHGLFALAILDMNLPGMPPKDFFTAISRIAARPPILVYSARSIEEINLAGKTVNAAGVLQKPAEMDTLLGMVRKEVKVPVGAH